MGFLTDIRSGKGAGAFGFAIFAWVIIGACIGAASSMFVQFEHRIPIVAVTGGLLGMTVGFYAEWGVSKVAKFLAVPGIILEQLWCALS